MFCTGERATLVENQYDKNKRKPNFGTNKKGQSDKQRIMYNAHNITGLGGFKILNVGFLPVSCVS